MASDRASRVGGDYYLVTSTFEYSRAPPSTTAVTSYTAHAGPRADAPEPTAARPAHAQRRHLVPTIATTAAPSTCDDAQDDSGGATSSSTPKTLPAPGLSPSGSNRAASTPRSARLDGKVYLTTGAASAPCASAQSDSTSRRQAPLRHQAALERHGGSSPEGRTSTKQRLLLPRHRRGRHRVRPHGHGRAQSESVGPFESNPRTPS